MVADDKTDSRRQRPALCSYLRSIGTVVRIVVLAIVLMELGRLSEGQARAAPTEAEPNKPSAQNSLLPSEAGAWVVNLDTRGGFTGKGRGGVRITSHGLVFARQIGLISIPLFPCRTDLSPTEFELIKQAVLKANPSAWKQRYAPSGDNGCCDRFRWTLTLHRREENGTEQTYTTFWYDANEGLLPKDLSAVVKETVTILDALLKECKR